MNEQFKLIEWNNDDVINIDGKLLKINQFKTDFHEEATSKIRSVLQELQYPSRNPNKPSSRPDYTKYNHLQKSSLGLCDIAIQLDSPKEGKECEILRLGATKWQKGRIRTQAVIKLEKEENSKVINTQTEFIIEFCPDEPEIIEPESPLDELRRQISEVT